MDDRTQVLREGPFIKEQSMETYKKLSFEYTRPLVVFLLVFASIGIIIAVTLLLNSFLEDTLPKLLISMTAAIAFFLSFRKRVKAQGSAHFQKDMIILKLRGKSYEFNASQVLDYKRDYYNGIVFTLSLKTGERIRMVANDNFCDTSEFEIFIEEFEDYVSHLSLEEGVSIERKPSFLERKWVLGALVLFTMAVMGALIYAAKTKSGNLSLLLIAVSVLLSMWAAYFQANRK